MIKQGAEVDANLGEPDMGASQRDLATTAQKSKPTDASRWGTTEYTRIEIALPADLVWDLRHRSIREKTSLSEFVERAMKDWKG